MNYFFYFNYFMNVAEIIATKFQAQEHKHVTVHTTEVTELNQKLSINT